MHITLPLIALRDILHWGAKAPQVVRHVALITQDLFVRTVLPAAHAAGTVFALPSWIVLAPVTVRLLHPSLPLPLLSTALPILVLRVPGLNAEYLIHKLDHNLLRGTRVLPEQRTKENCS